MTRRQYNTMKPTDPIFALSALHNSTLGTRMSEITEAAVRTRLEEAIDAYNGTYMCISGSRAGELADAMDKIAARCDAQGRMTYAIRSSDQPLQLDGFDSASLTNYSIKDAVTQGGLTAGLALITATTLANHKILGGLRGLPPFGWHLTSSGIKAASVVVFNKQVGDGRFADMHDIITTGVT